MREQEGQQPTHPLPYSTRPPPQKKLKSVMVKLQSAAGTGYFYMTRKNPMRTPHKLQVGAAHMPDNPLP